MTTVAGISRKHCKRSPQRRCMAVTRHILMCGLAGFAAAAVTHGQSAAATPSQKKLDVSCTLSPGPTRTVSRVIDGETLMLDDGSEVRLIGALAPRATDAGAAAGTWPPELAAVAFLSELVIGRRVRLAYGSGQRKDRYGRHIAHVFLDGEGATSWVQGAMLSAGWARAYGLAQNFACASELLGHESEARTAKLGLWSASTYRIKPASRPLYLMRLRNKYERVEGVVSVVARTASGAFINFGQDWKSDFTARISKEVLAREVNFEKSLSGLQGKRLTIRGWIERRNGPLIDISDPSQIEVEDQPDASSASSPVEPSSAGEREAIAPSDGQPNKNRPGGSDGTQPGGLDL